MAITITSQPSSINVTGTKLVYSISSSNANQPQFQYVTDVHLFNSSERLTRLFTYPNATGNGVLEISQILADNLEYDNDWKTASASLADNSFKSFTLHFSESFGSSLSSSVTIQSGDRTDGIQVFPGNIDPNGGTFDYEPRDVSAILTNQTEGYVAKGNYVTVPFYDVPNTYASFEDLYVEFKDSSGNILYENSCSLNSEPSTNWVIYQVGIGSGSVIFGNTFENTDWETIDVYLSGSATPSTTFNRVRECKDGITTFAFVNDYGYYDYYSIPNPVRKNTGVTRNLVDLPQVDYSTDNSQYDITRRGNTQYNTKYSDTFDITTEYINKATADWLTELFDSPEVYLQEEGDFIPVVITNTDYTWNTNENRQKLFQYTISYQYSNERFDR